MPHDVIMPQMGESIAEGTITTWLKKVGETVALDEPLFEISTDKVDAEIPSPAAGVLLEIKAQAGDTVPIDAVVAVIGQAGESAASAAPPPTSKPADTAAPATSAPAAVASSAPPAAQIATGAPESVAQRRRTKSSPVVRKIAAEHGIDISQIRGTGISGRVTKQDILTAVQGGATGTTGAETTRSGAHALPTMSDSAIPPPYQPQIFPGDRVEDLSTMRARIAEHMIWSRRLSAHVQTVWEVDFSHIDALRKKHKTAWQQQHGANPTFTSFAMKATVDALKAFPVLNASLEGQRVIYHRDVNLGLAVALDWGLIVPVIHNAGELNLLGLTRRAADLGARARDKKLKPDEVQRGTFTITNPGVFGNLFGLPIINQPQVAILGMGGIEKRPVVVESPAGDAIAIRTRAYLSLSFDHRLVDGAVADQFMAKVKKGIEEFDEGEL